MWAGLSPCPFFDNMLYKQRLKQAVVDASACDLEFDDYPAYRSLRQKIDDAENLITTETDDFCGIPNVDYDFRDDKEVDMDIDKTPMSKLELAEACTQNGTESKFKRFGFKVPESVDTTIKTD